MVYDPTEADAFRLRLLESPAERQNAEYKSSLPFDGKSDFSLKLLKHIQGMANGGGGSIIIGYTQEGDQPLEPDPNHTDEIAHTYDTTTLSDAANASVARGQSVELSVHPTKFEGRVYPIITVQRFKRQPVVCRSNVPKTLRQGAVYVRTPGAKTTELSRPDDWEDLIDRCVERRWDEFVKQHRGMFDAMTGRTPPEQDSSEKLTEWTNEMRKRALAEEPWTSARGYIEISRQLVGTDREWRRRELLAAATAAESLWTVVWDPKVTSDGIEDKDADSGAYWFLGEDGSFYFLRLFQEDVRAKAGHQNQVFWFDTSIWRIAEALLHSAALYRALRVGPDQPYVLSVKHHGLKGRELSCDDSAHADLVTRGSVSSDEQRSWSKTLTQDQVLIGKRELVREVAYNLLEVFELGVFEFEELFAGAFDAVLNKFGRTLYDKPFSS